MRAYVKSSPLRRLKMCVSRDKFVCGGWYTLRFRVSFCPLYSYALCGSYSFPTCNIKITIYAISAVLQDERVRSPVRERAVFHGHVCDIIHPSAAQPALPARRTPICGREGKVRGACTRQTQVGREHAIEGSSNRNTRIGLPVS